MKYRCRSSSQRQNYESFDQRWVTFYHHTICIQLQWNWTGQLYNLNQYKFCFSSVPGSLLGWDWWVKAFICPPTLYKKMSVGLPPQYFISYKIDEHGQHLLHPQHFKFWPNLILDKIFQISWRKKILPFLFYALIEVWLLMTRNRKEEESTQMDLMQWTRIPQTSIQEIICSMKKRGWEVGIR